MDLSGLQVAWLSTFVAVVEHGTITHAAKAVHLSQPRVSAHVAALERATHGRLFERVPRGVMLTALGREFLPFATRVLAELQDAGDTLSAAQNRLNGTVRFSSYPGASAAIVATTVQRFRRLHPEVEFDLHEGDAHAIEESIARGAVDWGIRPTGAPRRHPTLPSERLCFERVALITPLSEKISPRDLTALDGRTVIVSGDPHEGWADYRSLLTDGGITPGKVIVASMPTTVSAFVGAGLGFGILGAFAASASRHPATEIVELPAQTWSREIHIVHGDVRPERLASRAFLEMLKDEVATLSTSLAF